MIIKKITTGFVIQEFDTDLQKFVSQKFVAGDECDYEDEDGTAVEPCNQYLPYDMVQPE